MTILNLRYIFLLLSAVCVASLHGEIARDEFRADFRVNTAVIDTTFADNAASVEKIIAFIESLNHSPGTHITDVSFRGSASPEGSYEINSRLSHERMTALESLIRNRVDIPDSIITHDESYIAWDYLRDRVENSTLPYRDEVIAIIDEQPRLVTGNPGTLIDNRILKLKHLDGQNVWNDLLRTYFPEMRNAIAVIITYTPAEPLQAGDGYVAGADLSGVTPSGIIDVAPAPDVTGRVPKLYLKTNFAEWALAIVNIAVEADIARHWSFSLPIAWSSWDYFSCRLKFRTLNIQPEMRYWFRGDNNGVFIGAHFGLGSYNVATNGDYRIQDHDGTTPAIGGGLSIGYRLPVSRDGRWRMEFSVGAGIYRLHYDKFFNTRPTSSGLLDYSVHKTYRGIDGVSVSIIRTFDLKKRGGAR